MPTPAAETEQPGGGTAAKHVAEHASALAKLALELAGLPLKQKAGPFGTGAGLGAGTALVAVYAVGFLFATIAAALAIVLDLWLALLLVTLGLLLVTAVLGLIAVRMIKRGDASGPGAA